MAKIKLENLENQPPELQELSEEESRTVIGGDAESIWTTWITAILCGLLGLFI